MKFHLKKTRMKPFVLNSLFSSIVFIIMAFAITLILVELYYLILFGYFFITLIMLLAISCFGMLLGSINYFIFFISKYILRNFHLIGFTFLNSLFLLGMYYLYFSNIIL